MIASIIDLTEKTVPVNKFLNVSIKTKIHKKKFKWWDYLPTGIKVKSEIRFSISLTILSRPLARKVPELVRTLHAKKKVKMSL